MPHIALVDDESSILTSVSLALESEGFTVDTYSNGEEALFGLEAKKYDLGLFDIKMPRMNGNELLMKVRQSQNKNLKKMPVIFLTSKDQEQDEIIGLRMGAADYIKKPFSQKLLNERIKTVLRIYENRKNLDINNENNNINSLEKGNLILDDLKQLCFWKKQAIELTVAEFNYVDDRTIDSHIKRLRKKFKLFDDTFDQIRTRYGSGYSWRE